MQNRFPRVLFVAPVEPWCRENGANIVISDVLEGLAAVGKAEVFPVFLRKPPPHQTPRRPANIHGVTLGVRGLPKWFSTAGALLSGRSPLQMRFANAHVARAVVHAAQAREFLPTLVHVEHLPVVDIGLRVAKTFQCPLAYRAHNVESQLWGRRLGTGGPLKKWLVRRLARLEADAINACQITLCISDVEIGICFALFEVCPMVLVVSSHPDETFDHPCQLENCAGSRSARPLSCLPGCGSVIGVAGHPRHPRTSNPGRGVQRSTALNAMRTSVRDRSTPRSSSTVIAPLAIRSSTAGPARCFARAPAAIPNA